MRQNLARGEQDGGDGDGEEPMGHALIVDNMTGKIIIVGAEGANQDDADFTAWSEAHDDALERNIEKRSGELLRFVALSSRAVAGLVQFLQDRGGVG